MYMNVSPGSPETPPLLLSLSARDVHGPPLHHPTVPPPLQYTTSSSTTTLTHPYQLEKFMAVFAPMSEKTDSGARLRKEGFKYADPNGNGLCSMAEIENFISQSLFKAYPKSPKVGFARRASRDSRAQDRHRD